MRPSVLIRGWEPPLQLMSPVTRRAAQHRGIREALPRTTRGAPGEERGAPEAGEGAQRSSRAETGTATGWTREPDRSCGSEGGEDSEELGRGWVLVLVEAARVSSPLAPGAQATPGRFLPRAGCGRLASPARPPRVTDAWGRPPQPAAPPCAT